MSHDNHVTDSVSPEDEPKTKKRTAAFESDEDFHKTNAKEQLYLTIVMMKKQCNNELTHDILNNYC
jgi:hypothetical protein